MMHKNSRTDSSNITASIVGARGYSGLELVKLLLRHPSVNLTHAFATQDFSLTSDIVDRKAASVLCLKDDQLMKHLTDVVFLATPAEVSLKLAPPILAAGRKVIDLSGAFRLQKNDTHRWYGFMHQDRELLSEAEYGLNPFCGPAKKSTRLIANPGCYATAISLALIPLLKHDLIETQGLVIDAKSGTTGAGRKAGENLIFSEVDGECLPYRVGRHQHLPEIKEAVAAFAGSEIDPHFVTHLLPAKRGILAGVYATAKTTRIEDVNAAFAQEYGDYPLVRHGTEVDKYARLQHVNHTPYTHLSYTLTENKLYVFAAIDNLMKGAASQAVENLNRLLDLPSSFSLSEEA
ncbi:MAG: N-acetyl-gamma-glutamyl-phosphate reductase [Bdellovibrionales bacterium]|nr:N-acetyl-gamma-glutamyl-phosphate reductase [Bdellovibrionales bacterium]